MLEREQGLFSGRVSRLNDQAELIRLRIDFDNVRFLNKQDRVQIWLEHNIKLRCTGVILGKTNQYLLIKVPKLKECHNKVPFTVGAYVRLYSEDLSNNIDVAKELMEVLLKKRLAVSSKLDRTKRDLEAYKEKVLAVNKRYDVLRKKLELEREGELSNMEKDRATLMQNRSDLEIRLGDIDHKIEQYKIEDKNLRVDRWSLDPKLYLLK